MVIQYIHIGIHHIFKGITSSEAFFMASHCDIDTSLYLCYICIIRSFSHSFVIQFCTRYFLIRNRFESMFLERLFRPENVVFLGYACRWQPQPRRQGCEGKARCQASAGNATFLLNPSPSSKNDLDLIQAPINKKLQIMVLIRW